MPHRFKGDFSRLESEERKKLLPVEYILKEMNIQKGDTFIDFGCGIGYFSIPALEFVGEEGTVIAVDVSSKMLSELTKRAGNRKNLKIVHADTVRGLRADIILLSMVLHEIENPKEFLGICVSSLQPHGRIMVLDWQIQQTAGMGPPMEDRLAKEEVLKFAQMKYHEHRLHEWVYFLELLSE